MRRPIGLVLAAALAAYAVAPVSVRAQTGKGGSVLALEDRVVPGGRAVRVTLLQSEIATSIDLGRIAPMVNNGGVVGALYIQTIDDRKQQMEAADTAKAEMTAVPIRAALRDFDVSALALSATETGLATVDWFQPRDSVAITDSAVAGRAAFEASTDAAGLALIDYHYEISPDFSQIVIVGDVSLIQNGGVRGVPRRTVYRQRLRSVVQLDVRSYEPRENAARWSADTGRLIKAALRAGFQRFEQLIPYALRLSRTEIDGFLAKDHEKGFAAGLYGPLLKRDANGANGVLLWSTGPVHVQSVS